MTISDFQENLATSRTLPSYGIVTPVRDDENNLRRLATCLIRQTASPQTWIVVDDGSTDGSRAFLEILVSEYAWIRVVATEGGMLARGAPIVRAVHAGVAALAPLPDVVVKLDADISLDPDHFERLVTEFVGDPRLGIASGIGYEEDGRGSWRQRHGTGPAVWGACRAYRRECLEAVLPLEEHMGWDTLDLMKARLKGWKTEVFYDIPFRHHRLEGERDGHRLRTSMIQGEAAYFMGYRPSYLVARTLYRMLRDPSAIGLLRGYLRARSHAKPRCVDLELRAYVRNQQRLRNLPRRAREALRPRAVLVDRP